MIEYISSATTASSNATINATVPSVTSGSLLIALLSSEVGITNYTYPSGWIPIDLGFTPNRSHTGLAAFYKISTGSEPATATFVQVESKRQVCVIAAFSGTDTTSPINAALFTKSGSTSVSSYDAPSVTTTVQPTYLLRIWATSNTSFGTVTAPSGTTFIATVASNAALYIVGEDKTTAGATGVSNATWTNSPRAGGATIAIAGVAEVPTQFKRYNGSSWVDVDAQVIS